MSEIRVRELLVGVFGELHQYLPMSIFSTTHTLEQAFLLKVGKVELVLHNPYTIVVLAFTTKDVKRL